MFHATTDIDQHAAALSREYAAIDRLAFSSQVESEFVAYRRQSFLKINHSLFLISAVIYLSFIITDYAVVPEDYVPYVAAGRIFLAMLMLVGYYVIKHAQNRWARQHVFHILAALMLLVSLHISATSYFLPRPYGEVYILGIVQLYIVVPAILKPHSKLCLATMTGMLVMTMVALFISQKPSLTTDSNIINELILNFPTSFTLFLAGLIFLSAYTAYSYEKMLRQNWLDNRLTRIKSDNLADLSEQFKMLSHKDELTQLANRRSFQKSLYAELKQSYRLKAPFSLLMLDVDYFKRFNDTYGHQAGDDCLRQIADAIANTCQRNVDIPARYGGEEFMVISPNTGSEGAAYLAEEIRAAIEALAIPHEQSQFGVVTASVGITTAYRHIDADTLVNQVDTALYHAKSEARNCCRVYQSDIALSADQITPPESTQAPQKPSSALLSSSTTG